MKPLRLSAGFLVAVASMSPVACNATDEAILAAVEGACLLDSDCDAGLVCRFKLCHQPCETSKDCPLRDDGDRQDCVVVDKPVRVCLLEVERACTRHSDCADELLCGTDGVCRAPCATARDCTPGQVCASGTCAEPGDLEGPGQLPLADGTPREGAACVYNSDCPPGAGGRALRCRQGFCEASCLGDDRDCGRFERCSTHGTDPPEAGQCELIGPPGQLYCSPKDDFPHEQTITCRCPNGDEGTQTCNSDGSGYGPCQVGTTPCPLP